MHPPEPEPEPDPDPDTPPLPSTNPQVLIGMLCSGCEGGLGPALTLLKHAVAAAPRERRALSLHHETLQVGTAHSRSTYHTPHATRHTPTTITPTLPTHTLSRLGGCVGGRAAVPGERTGGVSRGEGYGV